jgi:outer membrane protein assembly factor BamB
MSQIIVGGTAPGKDPIVALGPKGRVLWQYGGTQGISAITGNVAYDSTQASPMLYALSGSTIYAMHLVTTGVDKFCTAAVTTPAGSPVLVAGAALVTDTSPTPRRVTAFAPANLAVNGGACSIVDFGRLTGKDGAKIGPPTANGNTVYWGYDNNPPTAGDTGIVSATFSGAAFSGVTAHAFGTGVAPYIAGALSFAALADAFFFGHNLNRIYYSFKLDYSSNWATPAFTGATSLVNPMVVAKGLALGSTTNSGQLYAFDKAAPGTQKWVFPAGGDLTNISLVATASDGMLYFTDSKNNELVALSPGTSSATMKWNFTGPVGVTLSGIGTEPTIDGNGILYFGQDSGNVYALITDVGAAAPAVGNDWPRTGFDNCNSSNAAFICQ